MGRTADLDHAVVGKAVGIDGRPAAGAPAASDFHFWYSRAKVDELSYPSPDMANGMDFGSDLMRVARDGLDGAVIEGERPVVYRLTDTERDTAEIDLEGVVTVETTDGTYAVGEAAGRLAASLDSQPTDLFVDGVLVDEPYAVPALEVLLETLLDNGMGTRLCYTTPGTIVDADRPTDHHREVIEETLESLGFDATPVSTGYAVVADQLRDENLTGLGINVDRDRTSVALVYYGVPVLAFSLAKGADWVVERAAGATGHAPDQLESRLESFALDPEASGDDIERALATAFDELTSDLLEAIRIEVEAADIERGIAVPVAVAGPWAVAGLEYLLGGRFDAASLPFSIRGSRRADDAGESAVRGALVSAQDDVDAFDEVIWSAHTREETAAGEPDAEAAESTAQLTFEEAVDSTSAPDDVANDAIEQLFDRLGTRDDELAELADRIATLADDLDELEATAADQSALDALGTELETVSSSLAAASETIDRLEERWSASESERDALVESIDSVESVLDDRLDTLSATHDSDVDRLDSGLSEHRRTLEEAVDDLESDIETVESSLSTDLDDAVDSIREDLARVETDLATVTDDLEGRLASLHDAIDTEASDRKAALDAVDDTIETLDAELSMELERVDERVERLDASVTTLDSTLDSIESTLEYTESTTDTNQEAIDTLESSLATVESTVSEVESEVASFDSALATLEPTVEEVSSTMSSVESDIETVAATVDDLEADVRELESAVGDRDATITELDARVADLDATVTTDADEGVTESNLGAVESTIEDVRSSVDEIETWRMETVDRLEAIEASRDSIDDGAVVLTSADVAGEGDTIASTSVVEERVEAVDSSVSAELESVREAIDAVDSRLDSDQSTVESSDDVSITEADLDRLETLDRTVPTLTDRLDAIDGRVDTFEDDLDSLTREIDEAVDRSELRETVEAAHAVDDTDLSTIESRLSSLESESDGVEVPAERVADLDQRVHELTRKVEAGEDADHGDDDGAEATIGGRNGLAATGVAALVAGATVLGSALVPSIGAAGVGTAALVLGAVLLAASTLGQ